MASAKIAAAWPFCSFLVCLATLGLNALRLVLPPEVRELLEGGVRARQAEQKGTRDNG